MRISGKYMTDRVSIAPLVTFRILFGLVMAISIIRFAARGWIAQMYIEPIIFFPYLGLEWVKPLGPLGMYSVFVVMWLSALGIMLGWRYRFSAISFFMLFTYVELIDKTNYLNHYYFVSIIAFLLILVPANRYFSLDAMRNTEIESSEVPAWTINIFKLQLGLVYFYAGIAKLNPDWLLRAMPLKIWLAGKSHIPVVGKLFNLEITAYAFSWFGALYDLAIPFLLLIKRTRIPAYLAVIVFHLATATLFRIGMFPYIMILSTLIFFPAEYHEKAIRIMREGIAKVFRGHKGTTVRHKGREQMSGVTARPLMSRAVLAVLCLHFTLQFLLPLRHFAYPGNLFWTEQGYRFSWRVMLMEKAGAVSLKVTDSATGKWEVVENSQYLTRYQEKMMSTQPDMILQYAHYIASEYERKGFTDPLVTADARVTLNGRRSRPLINPEVDLAKERNSITHKDWIAEYGQ